MRGLTLVVCLGMFAIVNVAFPTVAGGGGPGTDPSVIYPPGSDAHRLDRGTGIVRHLPGDPPGSRFGDYDPASYGWTWAPGSVPFRYRGHSFPNGVANADVAVIFTRILDVIVPKMREPLCENRDCWGYVVRTRSPSQTRSFHGYGLALDLNALTNLHTTKAMSRYTTTLPLDTGSLIRRYGAEWGGDWSAASPRDPMLIEIHLSPAGAARVAAGIRAGHSPAAPRSVRLGSTVTLSGTAAARVTVHVWLHKRGGRGYVARTVRSDGAGAWRTTYVADDDYRYYSTWGGRTSPPGRTRITPVATGPAIVRGGSSVVISGTARPGTALTLWTDELAVGSRLNHRAVPVSPSGHWRARFRAFDDTRCYVVDRATGEVSNAVVIRTS